MKPSRLKKHDRTANAAVACLDAAAVQRDRGNRLTMRALAIDAVAWMRRYPPVGQMTLPGL